MIRSLVALILSALPLAAQEFTTLKGHGGPVMGIAVTAEDQVVSASFDNSLGIWEAREPLWLDGHEAAVTALAVGPQGIVSGGDDFTIRLWQGDGGRELGRHKGKVTSLAIAPGGDWVASGSWDGTVRLWPLNEGAGRALPDPRGGVNAVAFGRDGRLFVGTTDGELLRYDAGKEPLPMVRHGFGINEIIVGEGWVAYGSVDGGTRVIDAESGALIADFTLDRRPILSMAYHAETHQIAVGDGHGYIMILDAAEWRITRDFRATNEGPVWALAFSVDGRTIWAGGLDSVVYGWPVETLDAFGGTMGQERSFLRDASTMPNGERQFMRKCSICHALEAGPSRKAGPTLHGVFGRKAGTLPGYLYSDTLNGSDIVWDDTTINALFDLGPDHYIPGSKMPMQVIAGAQDRADLIDFLKKETRKE